MIKLLVEEYGWIDTTIGATGNLVFFIGSIVFLPSFNGWQTTGRWLFIAGSLLMKFGAVGDIFVKIYEAQERRADGWARADAERALFRADRLPIERARACASTAAALP